MGCCKKEGCGATLLATKKPRHGTAIWCVGCGSRHRFCAKCNAPYRNFRKHRNEDHPPLYEFQKNKHQRLSRGEKGLFMSGLSMLAWVALENK